MNLSKPLRAASLFLHSLALRCRVYLPRRQCLAFVPPANPQQTGISQIYVINLDRQPNRWADVLRELACIVDSSGVPLTHRSNRFPATDAQSTQRNLTDIAEIDPFYSLGDQLYVEPQPHAFPDDFDLVRPIRMSEAEIAIAHSHIGVWKAIAQSSAPYALVLEDDVWFARDFSSVLDQAWREMKDADGGAPIFDVLYVSYAEARHGAPKELLSKNVFRPERGLWFLSGYVLSRKVGSIASSASSLPRPDRSMDKSQVPCAGRARPSSPGSQPACRSSFHEFLFNPSSAKHAWCS
ncbi:glycosyltransferase family 25 protein [Bradyrhizobium yuanmingense]|uniref:glycosyltransferase family 25 protein n=1 Tax=Bradyrhizobium yuanmingense TaxID=108015 RepID=UPI0035130606